ncbi:MAG: hypothetical protein EA406_00070, partial [Rhodospirillales bacterium]
MMRKVMMAALGGAALLMGSIGGAQAALIIDSFTVALDPNGGDAFIPTQPVLADFARLEVVPGAPIQMNKDVGLPQQIIGTTRKSVLELLPFNGVLQGGATFEIDPGPPGVADFSVNANSLASLTLTYDGGDGAANSVDTGGLLGQDLTAAGNAFQFSVLFADLGIEPPPSGVTVRVWDTGTGF